MPDDAAHRDELAWWLAGNYAPVSREVTASTLEVSGALPPELDGLYVRNGANPSGAPSRHWFLGQGMVHGVRLRAGKAEWYRNRALATPLLARAPSVVSATLPRPPTLTETASNVALVYHARQLLSLGEQGLPYEVSRADLSTLGVCDFGGKLRTNMTAHPKLDPDTGEMLFFGYDFLAPYLTFHRVSPDGELVETRAIELPASVMMHDFAVTRRRVVFMDLPIRFRLDRALCGDSFPFRWDDRHTARLGVMSRGGGGAPRWFEIEPCFVFHVVNAFEADEAGDLIVFDVVRYPRLWDGVTTAFDTLPALHRYRIDLARGRVTNEALDDRALEFPQVDARRSGRPNRYAYALHVRAGSSGVPGGMHGVLKYDLLSGIVQARLFGEHERCDELIFVPASPRAGEDEGYLLGYVYDARTHSSDLIVLDAQDVEAKPLARVRLPQRVPFGFHGLWVPDRVD
jgi:carotenoid cleavage dioxygenase-like enzyme